MLSHIIMKQILELREQGYSYKEIRKETGVSCVTISSYCSRYRPNLKNIAIRYKFTSHLDQITLLRRKGRTIEYIAKSVGLSETTIRKVCKIYCPGLRNIAQRKITPKQEIEIIQYYRYRYPIKQIAKMVGVSKNTVNRILKCQGFNPKLMYADR